MQKNNELAELLNTIATAIGADITSAEKRNSVRSILVKILVDEYAMEITKAFDMVWGSGAYEKMKAQVFNCLKAA